ncbi:MAG: DMT family transporter [Candidatus Actinomarina sp.]|tara:strand:+ start:3386 stop:4240 length:855 start_codon:yes stop_codon:yes gene_type:complete
MQIKNYLQILLTSSLWGSSFLMMKYALEELNAYNISFYRILIGMLFINLLNFKKSNFPIRKHFQLALVGLLWMSFPFYLFAKAEETITSSLAGLINGSTPIFISLIAVLVFKDKILKKQIIYLITGFIGIYFVSFGFSNAFEDLNLGALLALLASISYGFAANIVQSLIKEYGSLQTLKIALRYATVISFILLILNSSFTLPTYEISLFPMLLLGIGSSGIAFLSFYNLIDDVGAIAGSITVYIIPIFSMIFGYIFLNETTQIIQLIGIVTVIMSAFQFSKTKT